MRFNNIKKILKNKNGFSDAITVVPLVLVAMVLIVFFINLASYAQKYLAVKKATDNLLQIICRQGHITATIPSYFPGALVNGVNKQDDQYWVHSEMMDYIEDTFNNAGINDYNVHVKFDKLTNGKSKTIKDLEAHNASSGNIISEYGEKITVTISYKYKWSTGAETEVVTSRVGLSEYSYRDGDWASQ
ncbi:MAG: hypothetical protein IJH34_15640 [Romboutsia sp.]|nr:hypothetical protein [Romboutsia sp.]